MSLTKKIPAPGAQRNARREVRLKRVLLPTDFSPLSRAALAAAAPFLRSLAAEIRLLHVWELDPLASLIVAAPILVPEREVGRQLRERLRELAEELALPKRHLHVHLQEGRPSEVICAAADLFESDLIVLGTHGWTGLKHLLIGSTAERVVRHSPCPTLVMRTPQRKKRAGLTPRKILVPLDFSPLSGRGLDYAIAFAGRFEADLVLLHAVDLHYINSSPENMLSDYADLLRTVENLARKQMAELVRTTDWRGLKIETVIGTGQAGDRIVTSAANADADLIILSTHGRTGLRRALAGSTAEYVVRHASTPVLVVPSRRVGRRRPTT